jgi:hypothetical protein
LFCRRGQGRCGIKQHIWLGDASPSLPAWGIRRR